MITIYQDMDGCLCNFDAYYSSIIIPLGYDMGEGRPNNKQFQHFVKHCNVFERLNLMDDAHVLIAFLLSLPKDKFKVKILSSTGSTDPVHYQISSGQKLKWLGGHDLTWKANFVTGKKEKSVFANENSILIDDSLGCIEPFIEAGGRAIHHKNATDTIHQLRSMLGL